MKYQSTNLWKYKLYQRGQPNKDIDYLTVKELKTFFANPSYTLRKYLRRQGLWLSHKREILLGGLDDDLLVKDIQLESIVKEKPVRKPKVIKESATPKPRGKSGGRKSKLTKSIEDMTIKEISLLYSDHNSRIKQHSRQVYMLSDRPKECLFCKYNRSFEVCHIQPVKCACPDTLIGEINHIDNLIALCRNHHWEFDNGYLIPWKPIFTS